MKTAIIIHGAYGHPDENWFPWLKIELENIGYSVAIPIFPTPENQRLESWLEVLSGLHKEFGPETILIGHSVGVAFILSILESLDMPVMAVFLVSGFLGSLDNEEFDNLNKSFTVKEFNWRKIKDNAPIIHIYHSDNDPYVPTGKANELGEKLDIKPMIIKGAGHFNERAGYLEFPQLLSDIKILNN